MYLDNIKLIKRILKLLFFAILDGLVVWSAITLYIQQSYKFLAIMLICTILLNIIYLPNSKKVYPLRYILPGTLFMLVLVVYPILYTAYISITNYGTGHILSKEQVVNQLENRYYVPENTKDYNFTAYKDESGNFIILLNDQENYLLARDGTIEEISLKDKLHQDGRLRLKNYQPLEKKDIFQNLSKLQQLEFEYQKSIIRMKDFSVFTVYKQQYQYNSKDDSIIDLKNNDIYYAQEGYFVNKNGERLTPGFITHVGWKNFKRLFTDKQISEPFIRVFTWTNIWAFMSVLTTFVLGLILAILLNDKHLKFRRIYRALMILPYAIPAFISALVWRGLFDETVGVINGFLKTLFGSGLPWLTDPFWAKVAIIIVNLWLGFPYMMLIILGSLQSIPEENYEVAAIDGASPWQQFRYITLPMLLISVGPLLVSSFAFNFNNFNVIYLFNQGRPAIVGAQTPAGATDILISYTYRLSFESGRGSDFGLASAVTIIIFFITAIITWFNFRYTGALEEVKENA